MHDRPTYLRVPLCLAVVDLVAGLAVLEVEDGEEDVPVGPLRLPLHLRTQALLRLCKDKEGKVQFKRIPLHFKPIAQYIIIYSVFESFENNAA